MRFFPRHTFLLSAVLLFPFSGLAAHRHHRGSRTPTGSLSHQIDELLAAPAAAQAHWGISITTLNGRLVYEKNDAQLFAPASNAKLLTTSTALALFGQNTTIETRVLAPSAPDAQGTVHGDVTIVGAGDLSMSGRAYPYSGKTERPNPPLSALEALADQLQQRGVKRVEGNIVGDDTAFPQEPYGSGWAWDDLVWDYGAPISALTVNDNIVYLAITPGVQPGDPVTFTGIPMSPARSTRSKMTPAPPWQDRSHRWDWIAPSARTRFRLFGTLPAGGQPSHIALAVIDPAQFAAVAFRQMLDARGITVTGTATAHHRPSVDTSIYEESVMRPLALPAATQSGDVAQIAPAVPAGDVVLASRTSVPLLQDITVTNKVSQNLHAETWLRLLGQHFGEDGSIVEGARVVRAQMLRAGMQPQDFFFYDGSGLSPDDRITPRALTTLLRYIAEQPWGAQFRTTLPIGGIDGTLSDRFLHGPLHGQVFAKTGTLDEVNALSGYVTAKNGSTLVFSVLCNGHMPNAKGITKTIDGIVTAAAETTSVR